MDRGELNILQPPSPTLRLLYQTTLPSPDHLTLTPLGTSSPTSLLPSPFCYHMLQWFQSLWGLSFQFPGFLVSSALQPPVIFFLALTQQLIALVISYTDLATANIPTPFPGSHSLTIACYLSAHSLYQIVSQTWVGPIPSWNRSPFPPPPGHFQRSSLLWLTTVKFPDFIRTKQDKNSQRQLA